MAAFNSWCQDKKLWGFYFVKDLFTWDRNDEERRFTGEIKKKPIEVPDGRQLQIELEVGGYAHGIFLHCMSGVFGDGPKILRLSNVDFEVLEKTDLTLSIEDYSQPFQTMIVEWPEAYSESRETVDPRAGQFDPLSFDIHPAKHRPLFALVRHDKAVNAIFISIALSSNDVYNTVLYMTDRTIEESLAHKFSLESYEGSLPITEEEKVINHNVMRAAMNACLFVDDFGLKREGPENPKYHQRLQHFVEVARKSNSLERVRKAQRDLKKHPMVYSFEQDVKLSVKHETTPRNGEGGWTVKPHWRRGHYRMQRHGPGLTKEKRIRIDAVLVNGDLFGGGPKDTIVSLHD